VTFPQSPNAFQCLAHEEALKKNTVATEKLTTEMQSVGFRLTAGDKMLADHDVILKGPPEHPELGHMHRLPAAEVTLRFWSRLGWMVIGSVVTLSTAGVGALIIWAIIEMGKRKP